MHHNNLTYPIVYNTNTKAQQKSQRTTINEQLYSSTRNTVATAQYGTKLNSTQLKLTAHPHPHQKGENYLLSIHTTHNSIKHYSHNYSQNCYSPPALQEAFVKLNIGLDALSQDKAEPITLANGVQAQALHINGLTPHCDQTHIYLMTCNSCAGVADL